MKINNYISKKKYFKGGILFFILLLCSSLCSADTESLKKAEPVKLKWSTEHIMKLFDYMTWKEGRNVREEISCRINFLREQSTYQEYLDYAKAYKVYGEHPERLTEDINLKKEGLKVCIRIKNFDCIKEDKKEINRLLTIQKVLNNKAMKHIYDYMDPMCSYEGYKEEATRYFEDWNTHDINTGSRFLMNLIPSGTEENIRYCIFDFIRQEMTADELYIYRPQEKIEYVVNEANIKKIEEIVNRAFETKCRDLK